MFVEFTLKFSLFKGDDFKDEIFYDDFKMFSAINITAEDDVAYINLLKLNIDNQNKINRKLPIRNTLNILASEYSEFL